MSVLLTLINTVFSKTKNNNVLIFYFSDISSLFFLRTETMPALIPSGAASAMMLLRYVM